MAPTNIPQAAKRNDKDLENNNDDQRSESPKVPVRGRGAWKPTPKPLLPSQVMRLKLEAPKEPEIMRFGVPYFGRRSGGEDSDGEEGDEGGFSSDEPKVVVGIPEGKETLHSSIETKERKEVLLAEKATQNLNETWDLGPKNMEEREEEREEAQGQKRPEIPAEHRAKVKEQKMEEQTVEKPRLKSERIPECKQHKIYETPTTERKPFVMKGQSKLPERIHASRVWVRELSEGPRSPTIASKLKWVTRPSRPATPEGKRPTTPQLTRSLSKSTCSPNSRKSTPTGRLLFPPSESPFQRPSSAPGLGYGASASLSQGSSSRQHIPEPPIPVVPREHIMRLEKALEINAERVVEDMLSPLSPDLAPKPEVWDNRMRQEELCPSCRRCAVKFEFVCGDMICGGCYDRLLRESGGKRNVRCFACQAVVG